MLDVNYNLVNNSFNSCGGMIKDEAVKASVLRVKSPTATTGRIETFSGFFAFESRVKQVSRKNKD